MKKDKRMFKIEVKRLETLLNTLKNGIKLNGTQVILGETNLNNLVESCAYISKAIESLNKIDSHA